MRIFAPRKRAVILAQYSRHCRRVLAQPCKLTDDQKARILLVSLFDLLRVQTSETGNLPVKIVCVGRAVTGDAASGLRPAGSVGRMGMYHAADLPVCPVQLHMCSRIGGRIVSALDLIALQIHQHHVFRRQFIIVHAAGLDREDAALPVDLTDVPPCKSD